MAYFKQLDPGTILNNRYRVVRLIGKGGFGAVYRAWDLSLQKPCALKENTDTAPDSVRQFTREALILANLRHQNLPDVTDHFRIPDQGQYLVMEYVEGLDLQQLLDQNRGLLPENQVTAWIAQICNALDYLHKQSPPVIHRDIKPANIKIKPQGSVMLVDFGIAKLYDPAGKTTIGARAVTPGYSPPEQYGSGRTDHRSDIYSLGATLYTGLTGQVPVDSMKRQSGTPLPEPHYFNPGISPHVEAGILKAMQLSPELRYQQAVEFKSSLVIPQPTPVYQPFSTVPAPPPPVMPDTSQAGSKMYGSRQQKRPLWAAAIVTAVILFCITGLLASYWILTQLPTSGQATETQMILYVQGTQTAIALQPTETLIPPTPSQTQVIISATPENTPTFTPTLSPLPTFTSTRLSSPTSTTVVNEVTEWYPCSGLYASRLRVGDQAYVSYNPPLANNVRQNPSLSARLLGKLQPGEEMTIVDGPECNNNMVWWYIQASGRNLRGWTSEGDIENYWLVPIK